MLDTPQYHSHTCEPEPVWCPRPADSIVVAGCVHEHLFEFGLCAPRLHTLLETDIHCGECEDSAVDPHYRGIHIMRNKKIGV